MKYPLIALSLAVLAGCSSTDDTKTTEQASVNAPKASEAAPATKAAPEAKAAPAAKAVKASQPSAADDDTLYIVTKVPYAHPESIADNIKDECYLLGNQLSDSLTKYAKKQRVKVQQVDGELPQKGKVLALTIDNVYSGGNAFIGHRKSASVTAKLMIDGTQVDHTTKTRDSAGGVFGGFKGSCSVLAHTVNTLGNDIAKWAKTNKHLL